MLFIAAQLNIYSASLVTPSISQHWHWGDRQIEASGMGSLQVCRNTTNR
jgi:hypothetical protein